MSWEVKFKKICKDAKKPTKGSDRAACYDIYAAEDATITTDKVTLVRTGLEIEVPSGYFLEIRPRSGMSKIFRIANAPGTLDEDYRGELLIMVQLNPGQGERLLLSQGDRIAQVRLTKTYDISWTEVIDRELSATTRGKGGFGSTGVK